MTFLAHKNKILKKMRREDYKDFIANRQNCLRVGKAFLQFAELEINDTDLADLTVTYANWINYRHKLYVLSEEAKNNLTAPALSRYIEKSKKLSIGKYNTMRNIVRFMDKHLNIEHMGSVPANALYDELFGTGNWERSCYADR